MTSRQPGITSPGTIRAPGGPGTQGRADNPGHSRTPGGAAAQPWPLVVLPVALLIILGLAGLRGAVTRPQWNGPLHHDGAVIGLALEVVLGVLLVLTAGRRIRAARAAVFSQMPANEAAAKLRGVLMVVLGGGMIAVAAAIVVSLQPLASKVTPIRPLPAPRTGRRTGSKLPPQAHFRFPVAASLYALLIVVLVAAVVLSIWWARRLRLPARSREDGLVAEDPEDLREAVESGRSALRTVDDARAAIIACYVAMENSLAERGAARAAADTPDELLARATGSGLVRGTAAARLTALFYEARFSSHRLGRGQRDEAERALDELAAGLAEAGRAAGSAEPAEPAGAGA